MCLMLGPQLMEAFQDVCRALCRAHGSFESSVEAKGIISSSYLSGMKTPLMLTIHANKFPPEQFRKKILEFLY